MTVATEAGYTWTDGKHARLLHEGNRVKVRAISATAEAISGNAQLVNNALTRDRWKPFANGLTDGMDLIGADWTATNLTVASEGQLLTETAATGEHDISQAYTFTAVEHVVSVRLDRRSIPEVQLRANDGTTSFTCFFNLWTETAGTAANCTGQLIHLCGCTYELTIRFTPAAAAGVVELLMSNGSETVSYAGNTSNEVLVRRIAVSASAASLRVDTFEAQAATCFAIGAHNLGGAGARITLEHDSNEDDTWTSIGTVTPSDDSAIMFFFDTVTSSRWRITVDRGALPEIGVLRIGDPLTFQRPFYAGFTPARMNRATEIVGNISRTGELLGRSSKRTILQETFSWDNLTYDWVRANLDGRNGVIQGMELGTGFIAWRPSLTDDVSYIMRASVTPPSTKGVRDLCTFEMEAEVYSYE